MSNLYSENGSIVADDDVMNGKSRSNEKRALYSAMG